MKRKTSFWNRSAKLSPWSVGIGAMALLLAACGGDSSSSSDDDPLREVSSIYDLGACTTDREGDTVLVLDKGIDYLCENNDWIDITTSTDDGQQANKKDNPDYVIKNASITGAALKGPFKFDSPLELRELRLLNDSLRYSDNDYVDEISSNKGDFVIPKVNLVYPYAELVVKGQWQNEVTGQWSLNTLSLHALADLSGRTEVNVNLLTDLEYDRVVKLVNKGYSVLAAKKQAEFEIMTAFGFATTIENAEDLKMFVDSVDSKHDANATLMAISLLFVGDRSDSAFAASIDLFKNDFTPDGSWDNDQAKVEMADWAESFDKATVRVNVKSWNILDIPKFETYLDFFWNNVYGLGGCAEDRHGTIAKNTNTLSKNYNIHYICVDKSWRRATDYEKDTYQWTNGRDGEVRKGNVTNTYYTFNGSKWNVADRENTLGLCVGTTDVVVEYGDIYYICRSNSWQTATIVEYDTYGWTVGIDGEIKKGNVTNTYYTFNDSKWKVADRENTLGLCIGTTGVAAEYGGTYYICRSNNWQTATALEYDTYCLESGTDGTVRIGCVNTNKYYVYENGVWRASTGTIENNLGACVASRLGEVGKSGSTYYTCKTGGWTTSTVLEYDTYCLESETDGTVRRGCVNTNKYYVYENGVWRASTGTMENNLGACVASRLGEVGKSGGTYYTCKTGGWTTSTVLEYDTYGWTAGADGEVRIGNVNTNTYYVYENGAWRASSGTIENNLGACVTSRLGEVGRSGLIYYTCKTGGWTTSTVLEYDTYGWTAGADGEVRIGNVNTNTYYVYENGAWRASSGTIENNLGACVISRLGEVGKSGSAYYTCKTDGWTTSTVLEYDTYGWTAGTNGEVRPGNVITSNYYVCENGIWRAATGTIEIELGGCVVNRRGEVVKLENTYYICENSGWQTATPLEYDTYGWTAGTNGEVRPGNVNTSNYYVYENGIWRASTGAMEVELGGCVVNRRGEVVKFGDIYYICKNNGWQTATVLEYDTYGLECTSDKIGVISNGVVIGTSSYYCSAGGWISLMEWNWIVPKEYRFNTAVTYGTFTESIERGGQTYKIVTIGTGENTQIWMAENLNYYDASLSGRSWCYGRLVDTTPKCDVAGRLYKWSAAVGRTDEQCGHGTYCSFNERVQGICPEGWHLPSVNDWNTLFTNVGGEDVAGKVLKSQTGWNNYNGSSGNGTDIFGFSALPAGKWEDFGNGEFRSAGDCAVFWSATAQNIDGAYGVFLCSGMDKADLIKNDRSDMLSIRCVHD